MRPGPVVGALLLVSTISYGLSWWLKPDPKPVVTEADVRAYLAAHDKADQVRAFHSWRSYHPDVPRTIEFPEIATNPVLWDFTLHSVLSGEKRTWTWARSATISTAENTAIWASTIGSSSVWAGSCNNGAYGTSIIFPSLFPAASGGWP